jgi:hypothetical protein
MILGRRLGICGLATSPPGPTQESDPCYTTAKPLYNNSCTVDPSMPGSPSVLGSRKFLIRSYDNLIRWHHSDHLLLSLALRFSNDALAPTERCPVCATGSPIFGAGHCGPSFASLIHFCDVGKSSSRCSSNGCQSLVPMCLRPRLWRMAFAIL